MDSNGRASRIDHCFINEDWINQDFSVSVQYLNTYISDHCPLLVSFEQMSGAGGRPFRYFKSLPDHPDFLSLIQQAWSSKCEGYGLERVWHKLKVVKRNLKSLHLVHFQKLQEKINYWRSKLDQLQLALQDTPFSMALHSQEIHASAMLRKWFRIEEGGLRQKARIAWLHEGESNTHFLHSVVKERCKKNRIDALVDDCGDLLTDPEAIKTSITQFYKNLLGKAADSLKGINLQAMRTGLQLTMTQAQDLIKPISCTDLVREISESSRCNPFLNALQDLVQRICQRSPS